MTLEESSQKSPLTAFTGFIRKEFLPILTDLRLAIILLLAIALFSIAGTVIEQGQSIAFYQKNYPENPALFGFLTWKVLIILGLDHVYRTWWFLALLIFFGTSLTACTFTRQLPALKAARRWKFYDKPQRFQKLALSAEFDVDKNNFTSFTSIENLTEILQKRGYKVFQSDADKLYARKGIIGKIGPIIVHIGIVVILLGSILGAMTGFMAQEIVPSGETFQVKNIIDAGPWAAPQVTKDWAVKVNRFWIDYSPTGEIEQFYSDMSVLNREGKEVDKDTIYVNHPLRYKGVTIYQTDWAIAGVKIRLNKSPIFQLPMRQLNTGGKARIWGTWVPTKPDLSEGVSLLATDLQGTLIIYDVQGKLVNTVREGMSIEVNGVTLKILEVVGSTGLQIKADPGIPVVYAGFATLMMAVVMSYFSHSQIWVLQKEDNLYIGGKTNRAQVAFEREMIEIFEQINSQSKDESTKSLVSSL